MKNDCVCGRFLVTYQIMQRKAVETAKSLGIEHKNVKARKGWCGPCMHGEWLPLKHLISIFQKPLVDVQE